MSGQPITMCFLYEIMSGIDTEQSSGPLSGVEISSFAESAIMATVCGRVSNLRRLHVAEYGGQGLTQGFYRQHESVNTLLAARLQIISRQISTIQGHPDSLLIFLAISAYMAILMLYETLESKQLSPGSLETALTSSKQRALDGVGELGMLITILSRLNHFEVNSHGPSGLLYVL